MAKKTPRIDEFDFEPGRKLAGKYVVESLLGSGYEGEVYKVVELRTGISRAAKIFYPQRNVRDRATVTLGKIGPEAKEAMPALEAALEDEDELVRKEAARALESIRGKP